MDKVLAAKYLGKHPSGKKKLDINELLYSVNNVKLLI
jgi:hypothetical protein